MELDPNIAEINRETLIVPYEQWHPEVSPLFWQRLEVPGQPRNGTYIDPTQFDAKEHWNADASNHVSHHERLSYWDSHLSVAFAIEHYLHVSKLGAPSPRILEIGAWPPKNPVVTTQFDNTLIAILGQNNHFRVAGVDSVDLKTAFPYKSLTLPYFGNGTFIQGNFYDDEIQKKILRVLGGKPQVIVGNMVFERRLGNWGAAHQGIHSRESKLWAKQYLDHPDMPQAAEDVAIVANKFLPDQGVLVVCNRAYGAIPDFIHKMPLAAVYMDESGKKCFAQVREKLIKTI